MNKIIYTIDDKSYEVSIDHSPAFRFGKDDLLSGRNSDIAYGQSWYNEGYHTCRFLDDTEFRHLTKGLACCIEKIIESELGRTPENFELGKYHHVVKTNAEHLRVVARTR